VGERPGTVEGVELMDAAHSTPAHLDSGFWRGRRVLVTGHSGFKGSWLTLWLARLGARVTGIALPPVEGFGLFARARVADACESLTIDVRDRDALRTAVVAARPEVVFHLAAQPLVRASYASPVETWSTNVMGTVHLMEALREVSDLRALVVVTSDKCYAQDDRPDDDAARPFVETDALGGRDPYSASKAATEIVAASWASSFFDAEQVGIATARAGNVIGGGDGAIDRLIPDLVRSSIVRSSVGLRYPRAVRPWQHVVDPLHGYLMLAEALTRAPVAHAGAWNFGPDASDTLKVVEVADRFIEAFGHGARRHLAEDASLHEAAALQLDSGKAHERLGWRPRWSIDEAIAMTADGYRALIDGDDVRDTLFAQIDACVADAAEVVA